MPNEYTNGRPLLKLAWRDATAEIGGPHAILFIASIIVPIIGFVILIWTNKVGLERVERANLEVVRLMEKQTQVLQQDHTAITMAQAAFTKSLEERTCLMLIPKNLQLKAWTSRDGVCAFVRALAENT